MTKFEFEIHSLRDVPQFVDACAAWSYGEWASQHQMRSLQDVVNAYRERAASSDIPQAWVAVTDNKPIGTVTFKTKGEHPDFTDERPWLSSLFVHPHYRRCGVGEQLITKCEREAKETYGFDVLYLYTPLEAFYHRLGWTRIDTVRDPMGLHPEGEALMKKDLV